MASASDYPRDLAGYGRDPPDPRWPGGGRVALQFVLNFEEGGENAILHGDAASEAFLSDVLGAQPCDAAFQPLGQILERMMCVRKKGLTPRRGYVHGVQHDLTGVG